MQLSIFAIFASLALVVVGALAALRYLAARGNSGRALGQVDLLSYVLACAGALTLFPEAMHAFAPELFIGSTIVGTLIERFDYVAFVLVPFSFGMGIARRSITIFVTK